MSTREIPSGTVTFLFTDIEGSTKLLQELGDAAYGEAVEEHRRILREAFGGNRLGLQVAAELSENYRDGIWWVPLSSLRDSGLVLAAAGQVVGATDGLAGHIGDRSMLILFDNFEHLVGAAATLAELLTSCPNLDLLVTSREPLHLAGEQRVRGASSLSRRWNRPVPGQGARHPARA
jgi:class 3 adenylate cyclase